MSDLVYYRVPLQHMNFGYEGQCTHDCWTEFIVVDSESVYQKRNWYGNMLIDFFVDRTEKVAQFIWEMKEEYEQILIKKKLHRFGKKYYQETVYDKKELIEKLDELRDTRFKYYIILCTKEERTTKQISITEGEAIDLFVRNEDLDKIEKIISKWADKGDYFEYELGQTD